MTAAHVALAWLSGGFVVVVVVVAIVTATGRLASYRLLDRALIVQAAVTLATGLAGVATFLVGRPVGDPLHLLYGAVVGAAPLVARAIAQGREPASVGRWVAAAAVVALGATVRSFMTGR